MEFALGIALFAAFVVIVGLAVRLHMIISSIGERAAAQFEAWRQVECERIRREEHDLATRDANLALKHWKDEHTDRIRKEAVKQSQSVTAGKVTEHLAPYLPGFSYNPKDARFLGSPIDLLVFDGLDSGSLTEIVFIEVKTAASKLSDREQQLRDAIRARRVRWEEFRPDQSKNETKTLFPLESTI